MPNKDQAISVVPVQAINYIKAKKLKPSFSYQDVWNEEHAHAFTAAKTVGFEVTADLRNAVVEALKEGKTLKQFQKDLKPILEKKAGGVKKEERPLREVVNPKTGLKETATLGNPRRLKIIYDTNLNQAYQAGIWERSQKANSITHYIYRVGASIRHRPQHLAWDGLTLPKSDPFWLTHWPINGFNCKCSTNGISKNTYERYKNEGVPDLTKIEKGGGVSDKKIPIKTKAPKIVTEPFINKSTGQVMQVPQSLHPAFVTNSGFEGRNASLTSHAYSASQKAFTNTTGRNENLKQIFAGAPQKAYAKTFVNNAFAQDHQSGKLLSVAFLQDKEFNFLKAKGLKPNGTIVVEDKTVAFKATKDRSKSSTAKNLSQEEWENLPFILQTADKVFFDENNLNLVYLKDTDVENEVIRVIVEPSFTKSKKGTKVMFESIRTAFKVDKSDIETGKRYIKVR